MKHAYRWTALLVLSLLSACGGGGHSGPSTPPPPPATFAIGGSITGLTASGLVLLDNGSDTLQVAANATTYTFATKLGAGGGYAVTIPMQPTGETCSVANPSGTVGSSDVTNVNVSCSALATFTIGGNISGLTASGLVLLDNSGDALTVQAYGSTFTFATALVSGAAYAVTVKTQPAGETCQVTSDRGTVSANVTTVAVACTTGFSGRGTNVATVVVGPGPGDQNHQYFNMPYVSIKVCNTATPQQCAVIDNIQVDTGSSGLRLLASALTSANLTLTSQDSGGNTIEECHPYGGVAYSWGAVATATVTIGGETTSTPIAVQVIDGSTPPSACSSSGLTQQSSVNDFDANGVLGVGLFPQDCGPVCANPADVADSWYYSCPTPSTCAQATVALTGQVSEPVSAFTATGDKNGVVLQLPPVPAGGAPSATGYLVFGIGTQTNNATGSAKILVPDATGLITTKVAGQPVPTAPNAFFDSGSNYLAFEDSALTPCTGAGFTGFYCPPSTQSVTATNVDANGFTPPDVTFSIANLQDLFQTNPNNFAFNDVGGPLSGSFDWGLPFFFGRTVFTAIEGATVAGTTYSNGFYAY